MDYSQCKTLLDAVLRADIGQKANWSRLMTQAWWSNRNSCITQFGGLSEIQKYVDSFRINEWSSDSLISTAAVSDKPKSVIQTTTKITDSSTISSFFDAYLNQEIFSTLGYSLLVIIFIMVFYRLIRYLLEFLYDVFNSDRLIYLRVMQTRWDSKSDREAEKELAKDMKEKIGRMAQIYNNLHKLGDLSARDGFMNWLFKKSKIVLIYQYENGLLNFIIWVYPEYKKIVEGAISAQFSGSSIETIPMPDFFKKKYKDITVLEPTRDVVYPIKVYKNMPDDPINNIVDAIGKISSNDTVTVMLPIKPVWKWYNKRAKFVANALFKKEKSIAEWTPRWKYIIMPWKVLDFFISGPTQEMMTYFNPDGAHGDPMIRMVKAEEDSVQAMGEESANHAFSSGLILLTTSDSEENLQLNVDSLVSAYSVFEDQYANALSESNFKADLMGFFFKPMRYFAFKFKLTNFFFNYNIFSVNALSSVYHFPDGVYNRSPIIKWMDYKVLAAPDNVPVPTDYSGYIMTGIVAEEYKKWVLSDLLEWFSHPNVADKVEDVEKLVPLEQYKSGDLASKELVEKDGKKFVKTTEKQTKRGFKIYKDALLMGVNIYRNQYTPIYIKRNDRTRHHYVIWKSWGWKSVFIGALARQDIWNGDGVCVIDPHGDLVEGILEYVPKERARDIIYFDAGNEDRPMGLNLYEIDNIDQADRVVNDATEIFIKMFGSEIFGPRIQEYFKYGSLTLLEDFEDRPTLLDVPRLFTDETYREYKTKNVKNAVVKNFWEKTYNAMGDREKQEIIPYFTSKFVSFNTNRLIRNIIGQTKSGFRFRESMDSWKILLVSLSKGRIWEINAQLLGMILVSQIYNAAMSRANIPEEQRRDFYLYVDEFQNFVSGTFADILSEARKYRLALIMAHQYIAQLEWPKSDAGGKGDVKAAVFGNVGSMMSFKVGAPDAEFLEKEYAPVLSAQDIVWISNYKAYVKLNINNSTSRVFSMDTLWTQDYRNKKIAAILKEYSAKKYGRAREYVDAEIIARLGLSSEEEAPADETTEKANSETTTETPEQNAEAVAQESVVEENTQTEENTTTS